MVIGIDAGASWIKAGVFTDPRQPIRTVRVASGAVAGLDAYVSSMAAAVTEVAAEEPAVIGVALPAILSADRRLVRYMTNVRGMDHWGEFEVQRLAPVFSGQLVAENDAKCAALAEWRYGAGQGRRETRLLHVTWGTGIGTALVVDGVVQWGWEAGHLPVTQEASRHACGCGSRLDLEAQASIPNLIRQARQELLDWRDSPEPAKMLFDRAEMGDETAKKIVVTGLQWLARGLHAMSVVAMPDVVTVGGAAMRDDWLLTQLRQAVAAEGAGLSTLLLTPERVVRAELGNDAGMIGAAMLATHATV